MSPENWHDVAAAGLPLAALVVSVATLGVLTALSWRIARSRDEARTRRARALRRRLAPALWVVIALVVAATLFSQSRYGPLLGGQPLESTSVGARDALLLLATQLLVAQTALTAAVLTWHLGIRVPAPARGDAHEIGMALVSTLGLAAAVAAIGTAGILAYSAAR